MSADVITIGVDTKIFDAVDLMKKNDIHRLPVMQGERLVGLITEGTIQAAMPSKATSLSVYEVNYLLNKTTVADVMIQQVQTISPDAELEDAIYIMRKHKFGVLPVQAEGKLVGIITNNDIFDAFLTISGYLEGGSRIQVKIIEDKKGVLADLTAVLAANNYSISTIIVYHSQAGTVIESQINDPEPQKIRTLLEQHGFQVLRATLQEAKQ